MKNAFLDGEMHRSLTFFENVNEKIRQANSEHHVDQKRGEIPKLTYVNLYMSYMQALSNAELLQDAQAAWKAYDEAYRKFRDFNDEHHLPAAWNIPEAHVEGRFGRRIVESIETDGDATGSSQGTQNGNGAGVVPPGTQNDVEMDDDDVEDEDENGVTGLEELENVVKEEWATPGSHVLYWWKKGFGTQIFVRYGSGPNATYRIRAGSSEAYDPETVPQVLQSTSQQSEARGIYITARGREKKQELNPEGRIVERWKYDRADVQGIIGVGWKMKDDEEDEVEPLKAIYPERYVTYPHTRILIKWTDGVVTLEDRTFVRRITKGSALQGDRVIYQKALDQETRYCRAAGLSLPVLPGNATAQAEDEADEAESVDEEQNTVAGGARNGRSGTSEVRFAEPPAASARATPSRSAGPTPTHRQSAPHEDPRDAEIRELRWQVDQLRKQISKSRGHGGHPVRQAREDSGFYDGRSSVSYTPEAPPRRTWEDYGRRVSVRRR
jgi:hypothetical protein